MLTNRLYMSKLHAISLRIHVPWWLFFAGSPAFRQQKKETSVRHELHSALVGPDDITESTFCLSNELLYHSNLLTWKVDKIYIEFQQEALV